MLSPDFHLIEICMGSLNMLFKCGLITNANVTAFLLKSQTFMKTRTSWRRKEPWNVFFSIYWTM